MKDIILQALMVYTEWLEDEVINEGDETPVVEGIKDIDENQFEVRLNDSRKFLITVKEVTDGNSI